MKADINRRHHETNNGACADKSREDDNNVENRDMSRDSGLRLRFLPFPLPSPDAGSSLSTAAVTVECRTFPGSR